MDFRFTLSHTPKQSVSSDIDLPDNSEGENIAGSGNDWSEGVNPEVTVSGTIGIRQSDIWANAFTFSSGLDYTVNYSIDYSIHANVISTVVHFVILDGADNILFDDSESILSTGSGTLNTSSSFTAPGGAVKYGFYIVINNVLSNAGSVFTINNTITGTVATQAEPGVPTSQEISQPDGWEDCKLILERHDDFNSLIEHYDGGAGGAFIFYGNNGQENGGLDYLRYIEQTYGFNAKIDLLTEFSFSGIDYETIFSGQIDLLSKTEMPDNLAQAAIIREDAWSKFIKRRDTPVNLSSAVTIDGELCDPVPYVTLNLPSQKILQRYRGTIFETPDYVGIIANGEYFQIDFDKEEISEITEKYLLPRIDNPVLPESQLFAVDYAGDYEIDLRIDCGENIIANSMQASATRYEIYIRFNHEEIQLTTETINFGTGDSFTKYTYTGTRSLNPTDSISIYGKRVATGGGLFCMFGTNPESYTGIGYIEPSTIDSTFYTLIDPHLYVTAHTTYPESTAHAYLVHDVAAGIIERIVGRNMFYSEFLGSQSTNMRQYPENGCGWMYTIAKGLQIRGYTLDEKPFFISFNQWWNGLHPILCLGLGYERQDDSPGSDVIRVEQMDHFFSDDVSINFSNVRDITWQYDKEKIFSTIKVGYKKWEAEDVGGLDDPQTKRTYSTGL